MPSAVHLRALLFDIDGTLTDTEAVHFEAWLRILKPLGRTVARDHYDLNFVGLTSEAIVKRNFADLDPAIANRLPDEKEALFRSLLDQLVPTPGVLAFVARAKEAGLARAAVTNAPRANAELMLGKLGLLDEMQTLVIGDELAHGKPHPLPYLTALERLGVAAAEARVYEDSAAGVRSGVAAGIETVGVDVHSASIDAAHPLLALGARRVIRDFTRETFG
jgi:HAD superfamily hydrolase (TIGR01509 family)